MLNGNSMEDYVYRANLALLRKRLAETQDDDTRKIILRLLAEEEERIRAPEGAKMNHRGVEFSIVEEVGSGLWKWQFKFRDAVITGKTKTNLKGLAARRVQQRIDQELRKPLDLNSKRADNAVSPDAR